MELRKQLKFGSSRVVLFAILTICLCFLVSKLENLKQLRRRSKSSIEIKHTSHTWLPWNNSISILSSSPNFTSAHEPWVAKEIGYKVSSNLSIMSLTLESAMSHIHYSNATDDDYRESVYRNNTNFLIKEAAYNEQPPKNHRNALPTTTIIVQLIGEMGNNLARILTGRGLQLWAQREFGLETELVLRHENHWARRVDTMNAIKTCFPNLRHFNFTLGNQPYYNERKVEQQNTFGGKSELLRITSAKTDDVIKSLSTLHSILTANSSNIWNFSRYTVQTITVPFLLADFLALHDMWVDKYFDDLRDLFLYDEDRCCKTKADPDESVFHFRNYARESANFYKKGFEELGPNRTANELFRSLMPGEKVAILSRFPSDTLLQSYVDAFQRRGIHARIIEGQSGVEDFCFLLSTKKELVGLAESTFASYAAYLGNASKVRFYSIDSPIRHQSQFRHRVFFFFNWTNPKLQSKISFELYQANYSTLTI